MRVLAALAGSLALGLMLAACGDKAAEDDDRKASGQVLEGTISDSMLPLDTVRSQPPLAKETGTPGSGAGAPDAEATDAAEGEEAPADDAAPAEGDAAN